jgi:hypothetical protein
VRRELLAQPADLVHRRYRRCDLRAAGTAHDQPDGSKTHTWREAARALMQCSTAKARTRGSVCIWVIISCHEGVEQDQAKTRPRPGHRNELRTHLGVEAGRRSGLSLGERPPC